LSGGEFAFDAASNEYTVYEPNDGVYSFANPDELYSAFQSNFVFRWEYKPGSTFYAVWTHRQGKDDYVNAPRLNDNTMDLFSTAARDVFMVKLAYWFSL
jgi:hypothetical protein